MNIINLAEKKMYSKEVAQMIYDEFVVGTSSKMNLHMTEQFFFNTKVNSLPMTFIALINDECVGTISVFENDLKERPQYIPWLASLYVKPAFRNQKVGYQLMTHLLVQLKGFGFDEVYLKTDNASNYYQNRGWNFIETIHQLDSPPVDIFQYKLK